MRSEVRSIYTYIATAVHAITTPTVPVATITTSHYLQILISLYLVLQIYTPGPIFLLALSTCLGPIYYMYTIVLNSM